ncbi:MAG: colanic acid biosynthesis glycosyltransferase WcaL, partial [Polyangiales bacterium]
MKVAYLTNQYPSVSLTFVRREIAALEDKGIEIARFSIRPPPTKLVDPDDIAEQGRTTVLLARGIPMLALTTAWTAVRHPVRFAKALAMTLRMGLRSGRG